MARKALKQAEGGFSAARTENHAGMVQEGTQKAAGSRAPDTEEQTEQATAQSNNQAPLPRHVQITDPVRAASKAETLVQGENLEEKESDDIRAPVYEKSVRKVGQWLLEIESQEEDEQMEVRSFKREHAFNERYSDPGSLTRNREQSPTLTENESWMQVIDDDAEQAGNGKRQTDEEEESVMVIKQITKQGSATEGEEPPATELNAARSKSTGIRGKNESGTKDTTQETVTEGDRKERTKTT